jgi:hypothetical protein
MRAGQNAQPQHVRILFHDGARDHLGGLEDAGVDDLHAGIAERAGNDLRSPIMAIEPRLRHHHTQRLVHRVLLRLFAERIRKEEITLAKNAKTPRKRKKDPES